MVSLVSELTSYGWKNETLDHFLVVIASMILIRALLIVVCRLSSLEKFSHVEFLWSAWCLSYNLPMLGSGSARLGLARLGSIRLASLIELTNIGSGSARLINELLNGTRARLGLVDLMNVSDSPSLNKNCIALHFTAIPREQKP
ncbi:hypothetical protein LXL04_006669 [Taraxacum kok-saghyz]